ncbi:MAG: rhomboid family intramembrane serine protease [Chloroflexi bacterium]|nr:rhomboid family intramembrane serine protease [Chloroflexota bacterium]
MFPISDANPRKRGTPYVNVALIVINVAVFLFMLTMNGVDQDAFVYKFSLVPKELIDHVSYTTLHEPGTIVNIHTPVGNWVTVFTSMFLHGGLLHIGGNMVFLWVFGDNVEDRFGHFWYLLFYLAAGVAAGFAQVAIDPHSDVPSLGASGAIAGVLGAYLVFFPFNRVKTAVVFFLITFIELPAIVLLGVWFALQAFSGVGDIVTAQTNAGSGVAYFAHIGGFVFGLLIALVIKVVVRERLIPPRPPPDYWSLGRRRSWWN